MIKDNLARVQKQIDEAVSNRKTGMRTGDKVQLVAVSKTHPHQAVQEALAAGLHIFGENKVQEAAEKIPLVAGGEWHLLGHLQTNKVKKAIELFALIYSVDSTKLLTEIDKQAANAGKIQDVLLQVNIAEEQSKFGMPLKDLAGMLAFTDEMHNIRLRGLMIIAPEVDDAEAVRPVFRQGYQAFLQASDYPLKNGLVDILSMGMSSDFAVAIEEGANNIRLGTTLFGKRSYML